MNPFCAEHPLASQTSYFDRKAHPRLSWVCAVVVTAAFLAPMVFFVDLGLDAEWAAEVGSETSPFALSLADAVIEIAGAFIVCLIPAMLLVAIYRFVRRFA